jgi:hypothetical protein
MPISDSGSQSQPQGWLWLAGLGAASGTRALKGSKYEADSEEGQE